MVADGLGICFKGVTSQIEKILSSRKKPRVLLGRVCFVLQGGLVPVALLSVFWTVTCCRTTKMSAIDGDLL